MKNTIGTADIDKEYLVLKRGKLRPYNMMARLTPFIHMGLAV